MYMYEWVARRSIQLVHVEQHCAKVDSLGDWICPYKALYGTTNSIYKPRLPSIGNLKLFHRRYHNAVAVYVGVLDAPSRRLLHVHVYAPGMADDDFLTDTSCQRDKVLDEV